MIFNEGAYLTYRVSQSSIRPSKMVLLLFFDIFWYFFWERACVSFLMLSAKQGNYWYLICLMSVKHCHFTSTSSSSYRDKVKQKSFSMGESDMVNKCYWIKKQMESFHIEHMIIWICDIHVYGFICIWRDESHIGY